MVYKAEIEGKGKAPNKNASFFKPLCRIFGSSVAAGHVQVARARGEQGRGASMEQPNRVATGTAEEQAAFSQAAAAGARGTVVTGNCRRDLRSSGQHSRRKEV